jgi:hypothetical protein
MGEALRLDGSEEELVLVIGRKARGKRPIGRSRRRWVDNIKTDLGELRWGGVDWIGLSQCKGHLRPVVNTTVQD